VVEVRRVVGEVRLENIEPAIAIKISHGHAHPGLLVTVFAISTAGHDGDVCKRPIVIVVKENAGLGIYRNVNVWPAIVVKVVRHCGDRIARAGLENPCFFGDVAEGAVAVIVKQNVAPPKGAKQVVPTIVIVVANADAGLPSAAPKTGFGRHVGERAIAVVVIKLGGWCMARWPGSVQARSIGEINVKPPVLVVVEEYDSATLCLNDVTLLVNTAPHIRRRKSGLTCHIHKLNLRSGALRWCDSRNRRGL